MGGKKKEQIPKVILPPPLPLEVVDDDVQVSDEDIDFVKSNRAYTGFLKNLDTNSITRFDFSSVFCCPFSLLFIFCCNNE